MFALPKISIHAPAKGATYPLSACFISNSFQSTLPRRERPLRSHRALHSEHFNPRSREGSDNLHSTLAVYRLISIHAPAKGATKGSVHLLGILQISIHAPAKGATDHRRGARRLYRISIHAPAKGATHIGLRGEPAKLFQSTLPRRERHAFTEGIL